MEHEHEEAMRADFATYAELGQQMQRPSVTEYEIQLIDMRQHELAGRWESGPHAEHWTYLDDAHDDWTRCPATMTRFLDGVGYDRAAGYFVGVTEVEYRSQLQARDLTAAERDRRQERPPRQRAR